MADLGQFEVYLKELERKLESLPELAAVLAADLFDRNFETQSFFGQAWAPSKYVERENIKAGKNRNILQKTGALRKSIYYDIDKSSITFYSNVPYAQIHNEGGTIKHPGGTAFYKKGNAVVWVSNSDAAGKDFPRTKAHDIAIPERRFIGDHEQLDNELAKLIDELLKQ